MPRKLDIIFGHLEAYYWCRGTYVGSEVFLDRKAIGFIEYQAIKCSIEPWWCFRSTVEAERI